METGPRVIFHWLSARALPRACDLRRRGWRRIEDGKSSGEFDSDRVVTLVDRDCRSWPSVMKRAVVVDIADPRQRARLLLRGVGDVLAPGTRLDELAVRARRIIESAEQLPRWRRIGALTLDLMRRDAFVQGHRLCLHPREFEMAWHLAVLGSRGASRKSLLRDVWHLPREPETNSVAVHAFRLRAKLRVHGLDRMLASDRTGRYRLIALDEHDVLRDNAGDVEIEERERERTVV